MSKITVGQENSTPIELYYEDHGAGRPVVLIHGWPLSGASWEKQVTALVSAGHRVITYDRRGFGRSSRPSVGYDYATFAEDLHHVIKKLNLHDCTLVGFSMGGGEVARYLGIHGSKRVSQAVFISAITPCLLKSGDNLAGVDVAVFQGIQQAIEADRPAFLTKFFADFYNADVLGGTRISDPAAYASWIVAVGASPKGTLACVSAWLEDFRDDIAKIDVPTLILHGDADRILPIDATANALAKLMPDAVLKVVPDGPHGMTWTHSTLVNMELVNFLGQHSPALTA